MVFQTQMGRITVEEQEIVSMVAMMMMKDRKILIVVSTISE